MFSVLLRQRLGPRVVLMGGDIALRGGASQKAVWSLAGL